MATENQIKLAYRKTCLEHHPDKKSASEPPRAARGWSVLRPGAGAAAAAGA
jgi:curved DNA-binding protein CbpA